MHIRFFGNLLHSFRFLMGMLVNRLLQNPTVIHNNSHLLHVLDIAITHNVFYKIVPKNSVDFPSKSEQKMWKNTHRFCVGLSSFVNRLNVKNCFLMNQCC